MPLKLAALVGVVALAAWAVRLCRRHRPADRISETWLAEQEQRDMVQPFEGPSIQWPIRKILNESADWNARRLRRDA